MPKDLLAREKTRPWDPPSRIANAAIASGCKGVVDGEARPQDRLPPHAPAIRGDENRHGANEVGGHAEKSGALAARFPDAWEVGVLQIPHAPMNDLVGVGRRGVPEIPPFDESDTEPAGGRLPSRANAEDSAADDENIVFRRPEECGLSPHVSAALAPYSVSPSSLIA